MCTTIKPVIKTYVGYFKNVYTFPERRISISIHHSQKNKIKICVNTLYSSLTAAPILHKKVKYVISLHLHVQSLRRYTRQYAVAYMYWSRYVLALRSQVVTTVNSICIRNNVLVVHTARIPSHGYSAFLIKNMQNIITHTQRYSTVVHNVFCWQYTYM